MCSFSAPSPPPAPEPIPSTPPTVANATTRQDAPSTAVKRNDSGEAVGRSLNKASTASRKRLGRGSLRIPLSSVSGGSGLNFPSA